MKPMPKVLKPPNFLPKLPKLPVSPLASRQGPFGKLQGWIGRIPRPGSR